MAATSRIAGVQGTRRRSASRRRSNKHAAEKDGGSPPALLPVALSPADIEKTEALRQSILELMQVHQAALLWQRTKRPRAIR